MDGLPVALQRRLGGGAALLYDDSARGRRSPRAHRIPLDLSSGDSGEKTLCVKKGERGAGTLLGARSLAAVVIARGAKRAVAIQPDCFVAAQSAASRNDRRWRPRPTFSPGGRALDA